MTKWILTVIFFVTAGALGCQNSAPSPEVAASVNGKDIQRVEVEKHYNARTQDAVAGPSGDAARLLRLEIVRELIEREIMMQQAEQLQLLASDSDVEVRLAEVKALASPEEFEADLQRRGISEEDYRREIRRTLSIQKLVEDQVSSKVEVSSDEVSSFYEANKEMFNIQEPQYRIGQIAVSPNPDAPFANLKNDKARNEDQASKKIELLASKLEAGEDFQQVAREYSEDPRTAQLGGDLGYLPDSTLDQLGADLKLALLGLEVGETTSVLRAPDGYMILKLQGKREPGQLAVDHPEVEQSIRVELENRKRQLLSASFSEQIRNDSRVENFLAQEIWSEFHETP
jgi:peptidyl-prolyl cis-trans isomerase SurA